MKVILIIFSALLFKPNVFYSQEKASYLNNKISLGSGGENSILGIDYARNIYRSKIFLGIGAGLSGWTLYSRYEILHWNGLAPFISSGISYSFNETVSVSQGSEFLFISSGISFLPKLNRHIVPVIGVGVTYNSLLSGKAEGGIAAFSPLLKIGLAFSKKEKHKT